MSTDGIPDCFQVVVNAILATDNKNWMVFSISFMGGLLEITPNKNVSGRKRICIPVTSLIYSEVTIHCRGSFQGSNSENMLYVLYYFENCLRKHDFLTAETEPLTWKTILHTILLRAESCYTGRGPVGSSLFLIVLLSALGWVTSGAMYQFPCIYSCYLKYG